MVSRSTLTTHCTHATLSHIHSYTYTPFTFLCPLVLRSPRLLDPVAQFHHTLGSMVTMTHTPSPIPHTELPCHPVHMRDVPLSHMRPLATETYPSHSPTFLHHPSTTELPCHPVHLRYIHPHMSHTTHSVHFPCLTCSQLHSPSPSLH